MAESVCCTSVRQGFNNDYLKACDTGSSVRVDGKVIVKTTLNIDETRMDFEVWCEPGKARELENNLDKAFRNYIRDLMEIYRLYQC